MARLIKKDVRKRQKGQFENYIGKGKKLNEERNKKSKRKTELDGKEKKIKGKRKGASGNFMK